MKKTITTSDYDNLRKYAYEFISDKELADDLIQETFIKINGLINKDYDITNFKNFSITLLKNFFYRYIQTKHKQYELFDDNEILKYDIEDSSYNDTYDNLLDSLTTSITINDKLLVEHANGVSIKDLSIKYNYSVGAIKSRMHKRRLKIKEEYEYKRL